MFFEGTSQNLILLVIYNTFGKLFGYIFVANSSALFCYDALQFQKKHKEKIFYGDPSYLLFL